MNEQLITARLAVLLFTDIVGSTDFKSHYGINEYAPRLNRHNELFESIRNDYAGSHILKYTGDGYFAEFATPSDAVSFALRFQKALHDESWSQFPLKCRIGIHMGQVATLTVNSQPDVVGLAADLASRVMGLAEGAQTLLTRSPFEEAKQFHREGASAAGPACQKVGWKCWGKYLIKGSEDPVEIFEVGFEDIAPFNKPAGSDKAKPLDEADKLRLLDWKPEPGAPIPSKPEWVLQRKIGQGGFGDVWLAKNEEHGYLHVFKFCSDTNKLRSLKQEMHLFQHLRQKLGYRLDIAQLIDVNLKELPFFLESDFAEGGDLASWAVQQGGIDKVPLQKRIDIVAQIADALAAAHSVGVLHKDIKPSNVLIDLNFEVPAATGTKQVIGFQPRLADFGIGSLTPEENAKDPSPSATVTTSQTSQSIAPELLEGAEFTIQSDIYSLGVLLFQMVCGNLRRSLGQGWERHISDPFLREDIGACVDGDPTKRLASAAELANRLRTLEQRAKDREDQRLAELNRVRELERAEQARKDAVAAQEAARQQIRRTRIRAAVAFAVVVILLGGIGIYLRDRQVKRDMARNQAVADFLVDMLRSADPFKARAKGYGETILYVLDAAKSRLAGTAALVDQPAVRAVVCDCMGQVYRKFGKIDDAKWAYEQAVQADAAEPELDIKRRAMLEGRYAGSLLDATSDGDKEAKLQKVLADLEQIDGSLPPSDPSRAVWRYQKARAERAENNSGEAIQLLTDAISIGATANFDGDEQRRKQFNLACECELALILQDERDRSREARTYFDIIEKALATDNFTDSLVKARCCRALAKMHLKNNELDAATKYAGEALDLTRDALGDQCLDTVWAQYDLAAVLQQAHNYGEEAKHRAEIYNWACHTSSPMRAMFAGRYGLCLVMLNQPSQAAPVLDDCIKQFTSSDNRSPEDEQLLSDAQAARKTIAPMGSVLR